MKGRRRKGGGLGRGRGARKSRPQAGCSAQAAGLSRHWRGCGVGGQRSGSGDMPRQRSRPGVPRVSRENHSGHPRRAEQGRALSPTASVMKATWMKSDSQLSTYMNHIAPPVPPAPRQPGRACALGLGRHGAAAAASQPRVRSVGWPCAAAERSPARAPPSSLFGPAPPVGEEGSLSVPRAVGRSWTHGLP